jgi:hypothetical protein
MRRNVRQHVSGGDAARGAQAGMVDSVLRSGGGQGMTDATMRALGLDPDRVTQTRRAVRRQTMDPR